MIGTRTPESSRVQDKTWQLFLLHMHLNTMLCYTADVQAQKNPLAVYAHTEYIYGAVHTHKCVLVSITCCCYPEARNYGVRGTVTNMHTHAEHVKCKPQHKAE